MILPVANQADHIGPIVERMLAGVRGLDNPIEVILVVNGSQDGTEAICAELASRHPEVASITSKRGWGAAVRAGIEASSGDLLCYTNSARTEPDDLALALRYGLVNDRVVVKASRKVRDSLLRRAGSVIYNFEARMLFGLAVWDVNGTPKVFPRDLLPRLDLTEDGDLIDLQFIVNCRRHGIPIVEMPVYLAVRHGGRSTTRIQSAVRMYRGALSMFWRGRRRAAR